MTGTPPRIHLVFGPGAPPFKRAYCDCGWDTPGDVVGPEAAELAEAHVATHTRPPSRQVCDECESANGSVQPHIYPECNDIWRCHECGNVMSVEA